MCEGFGYNFLNTTLAITCTTSAHACGSGGVCLFVSLLLLLFWCQKKVRVRTYVSTLLLRRERTDKQMIQFTQPARHDVIIGEVFKEKEHDRQAIFSDKSIRYRHGPLSRRRVLQRNLTHHIQINIRTTSIQCKCPPPYTHPCFWTDCIPHYR